VARKFDLPHSAKYDLDTNEVEYPIGAFVLKLPIEEFLLFFVEIQEIAFAIQTLSEVDTSICRSCGHVDEQIIINPDKPADA
jgi:hypothetical protein